MHIRIRGYGCKRIRIRGGPLYTTKHANAKPGSDSQGFVELRIKLVFYPIDHLTHFFKSIDGRLSVIQCHP